MPSLDWKGKQRSAPQPVSLNLDSVIYPGGAGYPAALPANQLYLGDNFGLMSSLLEAYEAKIDLIYADPPFFTNRKFSARIGRGEDSRKPAQWQLAESYGDSWLNLDEYIQFLYERLELMYRLLAPTGTLYLHLDWHANAYARLLLDEIFGPERLLNEIIWAYHGPSPIRSAFNRKHDTLFAYTKSETYTFNADAVRVPYDPSTLKTFASSSKAGFGKVPNLARGKVPEDWWYFPVVARLHGERTGYPTQKPEALLKRIILASSNPGDLVADFFCGSGTTPLVAARHGRRFLASDATFRALHTARTRLVRENAQSFEIWTAQPPKMEDSPHFQFQREAQQVQLLGENIPAYWELDPAWDGRTFKSQAQALLPLRKGAIPLVLPLPAKTGEICVRAVTAEGHQSQSALE
ncbi:MAG: site-specific DNA-methyltransferase [Anaerolineales bacterium]|jgi:DNA modification methylase|nr:site-specific DNA-methyltransferase [Anaerolineales bacterium]